MTVTTTDDSSVQRGVGGSGNGSENGNGSSGNVNMRIGRVTAFFAVLIWGVIVVMNVALLALLGLGVA